MARWIEVVYRELAALVALVVTGVMITLGRTAGR